MSKKLDLGECEFALGKPNCQAMLLTDDKNLLDVIHMRREILGEDKNVIHIDEAEWKITQKFIHKALECVTGIPEAKGHAQEFKHPKGVMMVVFWTSSGDTGT